jgi:hypothetical protein
MPSSSSKDDVIAAAQITLGYVLVYSAALLYQTVCKSRLIERYRALDKPLNRYEAVEMRSPDRLVANMMEWGLGFLPLLWVLGVADRLGDSVKYVAWTYVALRALYVGLVARYGVATGGRNKPLWISTFPSYFCLLYLLGRALPVLFQ